MTTDDPTIPGLDMPKDPDARRSDLEAAVRATIRELHAQGNVKPKDAARVALCLELAQVITDKRSSKRTSTIGNDARVLKELLDDMVPAAAAEGDAALRDAMERWELQIAEEERNANGGGDDAGHAAAEVRDEA